ncbi:MAG: hypothetical protein JWO90_1771 [Solirubrobacterales bacterium]|jgi:hypothetical protein|nr:hypothetical protein [Solirubrobacterales bacterium]
MSDTPVLSNVTYDELVTGARMGPYAEHVSAAAAAQLAGAIGEPVAVSDAPPAVFPVLFLKGLRRAMGGIPPGSVLAKQELEFHAVLPVDSDVAITVWVGDKQVRRERPFVTIEFDVRSAQDKQVVTGRKVIVWPTGPGQEAAA